MTERVLIRKIAGIGKQKLKMASNNECRKVDGAATLLASAGRVIVFLVGVCGLMSLSGLTGMEHAYATNSVLTMSIDYSNITINVAPRSANGTFAKSNNSIISVNTNNYSGYTLSIAASSDSENNTDLINTSDSNKVLSSIVDSTSELDFSADTAVAGANYNGKWGYLPSKLNSIDNTSFQPAPGVGDDIHILDVTDSANTDNMANTYTLAIGARVDNNTALGSYSNTFVISAVANLMDYTVAYNKGNTTDAVSNLPANATGVISNPLTDLTTITVSDTKPMRVGYLFDGWCTVNPTVGINGAADNCSGATIQAGGNYDLDATVSPDVTLYALWRPGPCLGHEEELRCKVYSEWEQGGLRVQTNDENIDTGIKAAITESNSGVFKYNSNEFGASSDASYDYDIFYYRGILDGNLDGTLDTYGSAGDGTVWPNYVRMDDTCWRIVRTTGSGGVKMIYNGLYSGGTTPNSCANNTTDAEVTRIPFNSSGSRQIVTAGYTFNSNYKTTTSNTAYGTLFGSNTDYAGNSTSSTAKSYIEGTWFSAISDYEDMLEPSAGYCNDRTIYTATSGEAAQVAIADDYPIVRPTTSGSGAVPYYFATYIRDELAVQDLTLACPRSGADLYTTIDAADGNRQLGKPVALLTADEMSFAGSGFGHNGENDNSCPAYHVDSYLYSGSSFWSMSPIYRWDSGLISGTGLDWDGMLDGLGNVGTTRGIRPAVSLKLGVVPASGSGTATDPWVMNNM